MVLVVASRRNTTTTTTTTPTTTTRVATNHKYPSQSHVTITFIVFTKISLLVEFGLVFLTEVHFLYDCDPYWNKIDVLPRGFRSKPSILCEFTQDIHYLVANA